MESMKSEEASTGAPRTPAAACLAVAGPVKDNTVHLTNCKWTIEGAAVAAAFGIRTVLLINDFLAMGYGLLTLTPQEVVPLQNAPKQTDKPIACIGAGTGLGECFLTPDSEGRYTCFPTEGGHAEFAPRDDLEVELLAFLKQRFAAKHRVSVERVASGTGLVNIYDFLVQHPVWKEQVDPALHARIEASDDKSREIATNTSNALCHKTMEIFARAYGAEAGVAALKWLPYGGLYLTGGLTPKNISLIRDGPFLEAFLDKGRVSGMLSSVPLYAVMVEDLGERGAKYVALDLLQKDLIQAARAQTPASAVAPVAAAVAVKEGGCKACGLLIAGAVVGAAVAIGMMVANRRR